MTQNKFLAFYVSIGFKTLPIWHMDSSLFVPSFLENFKRL